MSRVAVIGNTPRAIGAVCAADLTLAGHQVRFAVFPEQRDQLSAVRKAGGFSVEGDAKHLVSKKTGFAKLDRICDTTAEPSIMTPNMLRTRRSYPLSANQPTRAAARTKPPR